MSGFFWFMMLAAVVGASMAVQGTWNAALGKTIGVLEATLIVQVLGSLSVLALLAFNWNRDNWANFGQAPWYAYLGGLLGTIIVYGGALAIPRVGIANATTAIVAAQIAAAVVLEHFGAFGVKTIPFSWAKLAGMLLLVLGTRLMLARY